MSEPEITIKETGEGYWKRTEVDARLPDDRLHRTRMSFTRGQGCASLTFSPMDLNVASSSDENLMDRLRLLKALLNAIPEL